MVAEELRQQVAQVKRELASLLLCNDATVAKLTQLLINTKEASPSQINASASRKPTARGQVNGLVGKKGSERGHNDQARSGLGSDEKLKLATEVANMSLSLLTAAVKSLGEPKPSEERKHGHDEQLQKVPVGRTITPLQSRSTNILSSPRMAASFAKSSSVPPSAAHVLAVAKCARVGFQALRCLENETSRPREQPLQLDMGISALIAKLVTLELDDLAIAELSLLQGRLSPPKTTDKSQKIKKMVSTPQEAPRRPLLAGLLDFSSVHSEWQAISIALASQISTLKLCKRKPCHKLLASIISHMEPASSHSPLHLANRMVTNEATSIREKAARQLEQIAQLLLSLCASTPSKKATEECWYRVTFRCQILVMQLRRKWWILSGHDVKPRKDFQDPLIRYIRHFILHSGASLEETCQMVSDSLHAVQSPPGDDSLYWKDEAAFASTWLEAYSCLAEYSYTHQAWASSLQYFGVLSSLLKTTQASPAKLASIQCQILNAEIRSSVQLSSQLEVPINDATRLITEDLSGDSSDLDDLFLSISRLTKSVHKFLYQLQKTEIPLDSTSVAAKKSCVDLLTSSIGFLVRYLGTDTSTGASQKVSQRYQCRLKAVRAVARPTIEGICSLVKFPWANEGKTWKDLDHGLATARRLASMLEMAGDPGDSTVDLGRNSFAVLFSNAYWCHFLHQSPSEETAAIILSLKNAIHCLKDRTGTEAVEGFLSKKYEKLAALYHRSSQWAKASEALESALDVEIAAGTLRQAVDIAASLSWEAASRSRPLETISRILIAYLNASRKLSLLKKCDFAIIDRASLINTNRGLLIEMQLRCLMEDSRIAQTSQVTQEALQALRKEVLQLYTEDMFPVRRARVLTCLMSATTLDLELPPPEPAIIDLPLTSGPDDNIIILVKHLYQRQQAYHAISREFGDISLLWRILQDWFKMIASADTSEDLSAVDDKQAWLVQLDLIASWLSIKGYEMEHATILDATMKMHTLLSSSSLSQVSQMTSLGLALSRLGFSEEAGAVLHRACHRAEANPVPEAISFQLCLAQAEYLLSIGSLSRGGESMETARAILQAASARLTGDSLRDRYEHMWISTEFCTLSYLRATTEDRFPEALYYAGKALKQSYRLWAILEHQQRRSDDAPSINLDSSSENLDSRPQHIPIMRTTHEALNSAPFWPLASRIFRHLAHLSELFSRQGLLLEAIFYKQKASVMANALGAPKLQQKIANLTHYLDLCCKTIPSASTFVQVQNLGLKSYHDALGQIRLAEGHIIGDHIEMAHEVISSTSDLLDNLRPPISLSRKPPQTLPKPNLEQSLQALSVQDDELPRRRPKTKVVVKRRGIKAGSQIASVLTTIPHKSASLSHTPLEQARSKLSRLGVVIATLRGQVERADTLLQESTHTSASRHDILEIALCKSQLHLKRGISELLTDALFSILPDSAISCPSTSLGARRQSKEVNFTKVDTGKPSRSKGARAKPAEISIGNGSTAATFINQLSQSLELLVRHCLLAQTAASTFQLRVLSQILTKSSMLVSAASTAPSSIPGVSPSFISYASELASISVTRIERSVIGIDQLLDAESAGLVRHDSILPCDLEFSGIEFETFQELYIDIIPSEWTVLSLSLSENHDELRISRLRSGESPFVLVIPLRRNASSEMDEEIFDFDHGKAELLKIIDLANYSARDAGDTTQRGAKRAWWDARAALDARLKDLLVNIENIWLGGFRGIFSQNRLPQDLLSRFQQKLYASLDQHLPSRQKSARSPKQARAGLDSRVLELFVGLGDPREHPDLEEPMLDLLYFVVDILQFHGERNAYDEIDFDSMTIEILEALTHFHEAFRDHGPLDQHTILILDKSLHSFPWESLPRLEGQAVSRLPSLEFLRLRILQIQPNVTNTGIIVDISHGSYILNPAGDLTSTQEKFAKPLSRLEWPSLVNETPNKESIKAFLSRSLYLYFGHGSGSQYFPPRAIKKLNKCAVAILMGCSSASVTTAGEFESYGVPFDYLQAGSPAVVGTLWDVTDKDIDRFSMTLLEQWGLFGEDESDYHRGGGTERVDEPRRGGRYSNSGIGLDAAVARGRESCILRYLNGAAPVVYGIPVFLSRPKVEA